MLEVHTKSSQATLLLLLLLLLLLVEVHELPVLAAEEDELVAHALLCHGACAVRILYANLMLANFQVAEGILLRFAELKIGNVRNLVDNHHQQTITL